MKMLDGLRAAELQVARFQGALELLDYLIQQANAPMETPATQDGK